VHFMQKLWITKGCSRVVEWLESGVFTGMAEVPLFAWEISWKILNSWKYLLLWGWCFFDSTNPFLDIDLVPWMVVRLIWPEIRRLSVHFTWSSLRFIED